MKRYEIAPSSILSSGTAAILQFQVDILPAAEPNAASQGRAGNRYSIGSTVPGWDGIDDGKAISNRPHGKCIRLYEVTT